MKTKCLTHLVCTLSACLADSFDVVISELSTSDRKWASCLSTNNHKLFRGGGGDTVHYHCGRISLDLYCFLFFCRLPFCGRIITLSTKFPRHPYP